MTERSRLPIVVGGCHRSGTSLVRRILNAHPGIHCGPELTFLRDFHGDFHGDPFARLRFARTARDYLSEDDALRALGRAFLEVHELAARRAGKARWADKAPENVIHLDTWEDLLDGGFLFVHVVRGPLDNVASMQGRFPLTLPEELDARVDLYRAYTEAGLTFGDECPERYHRVVYEELCLDPAASVDELMTWLGEEPDDAQLAFNTNLHQEGLEDPKVAETSQVHRESVGRWRSVLTDGEAEHVWARTSDLWAQVDPAGRHWPALGRGSSPPHRGTTMTGS